MNNSEQGQGFTRLEYFETYKHVRQVTCPLQFELSEN